MEGSLDNLEDQGCIDHPNFSLNIADLSSFGDWVDYFKDIDCVYHLADIVAGIGYVFGNEGFIFRKNLVINANVANAVEIMGISRYVYVGTACSFPLELQTGIDSKPLDEKDQFPANPESAYGWSKLMGELDANYLNKYSGIDSVTLVLHNVYGTPCDYKTERSQVIPALAYKALNAKKNDNKLSVWGDGSQGRAFVHVRDVINALILALNAGENSGAIQIGRDICTSIREIAETLKAKIDESIIINYDISKPTGDKGRCANYSKAKKLLSWEPTINIEDGLEDLLDWIKSKEKNA